MTAIDSLEPVLRDRRTAQVAGKPLQTGAGVVP